MEDPRRLGLIVRTSSGWTWAVAERGLMGEEATCDDAKAVLIAAMLRLRGE
jgi:hypothetical protein